MKKLNEKLQEKLGAEVTSFVTCCLIKLKCGEHICLTTSDVDLNIGNLVFKACNGLKPSAIASNHELSVDNLEVTAFIDSELITTEDVLAGKFDNADVSIFLVDQFEPEAGVVNLQTGTIGEIKNHSGQFVAEVRGLTQALSQNIGELYSPLCRANFCDKRCGLLARDFKVAVTVIEVINHTKLRIELENDLKNGELAYGIMEFSNVGTIEIKNNFNNVVELMIPFTHEVKPGEECIVMKGCDKKFDTCIEKFNNAINFRGEPHL